MASQFSPADYASDILPKRYGSKLVQAVTKYSTFMELFPFLKKEKQGLDYNFPIALTRSGGLTLLGSNPGKVTLNDAISPAVKMATLSASAIWHSEAITEEMITRSAGGNPDYMNELDVVMDVLDAAVGTDFDEICLKGQVGLAASTNVSATGTTVTFPVTAATWAASSWLGAEGLTFDIFAATNSASKSNGTASLTLSAVDIDNKTLSLTCDSLDTAAIDALTNGVLYRAGAKTGASTFKEAEGIHSLMSKSSGTVHGINVANYSLWKCPQSNASGALTFAKLQRAAIKPANAGARGDLVVLLPNASFADVATEQAALRQYDKSYTEAEFKNGAKAVTFVNNNGSLTLMAHPLVWEGYAYVIKKDAWIRIGSSEPHSPQLQSGKVERINRTNAYAVDVSMDQAIMTRGLAHNCLITGVTPTAY